MGKVISAKRTQYVLSYIALSFELLSILFLATMLVLSEDLPRIKDQPLTFVEHEYNSMYIGTLYSVFISL